MIGGEAVYGAADFMRRLGAQRLDHLVRQGLVRPGRGTVPRAIPDTPPPAPILGASAVRALLDERREGR
jgi:hypothetical protein